MASLSASALLLTAIVCLLPTVNTATDVDRMLRTNQYMFISQYRCIVTYEDRLKHEYCPAAFYAYDEPNRNCDVKHLHMVLIRDPHELRPPRLLTVDYKSRLRYRIEDIPYPSQRAEFDQLAPLTSRYLPEMPPYLDKVNAVLYDDEAQLLYIYVTTSSYRQVDSEYKQLANYKCYVYLVLPEDVISPLQLIDKFDVHDTVLQRQDWTVDAYQRKAFYRLDGKLYSIPTNRLLVAFKAGHKGDPVEPHIAIEGNHIGIYGGLLVNRTVPAPSIRKKETRTIVSALRPLNESVPGMLCQYNVTGTIPINLPVLLIRDWDYCLVRNINATRTECESERNNWLTAQELFEKPASNLWLIILLVVVVAALFMLTLLLCVYVIWLRHTLDDMDFEPPPVQGKISPRRYGGSGQLAVYDELVPYNKIPAGYTMDASIDRITCYGEQQ